MQDHEHCDVELDDVLGLRVGAIGLSFVLAGDEVVEFFEGVEGGLLAAIGHVLADAEVGLVGVDVGGVGGEGTSCGEEYFSAYLYLPALKNWYACSINQFI